MHSSVNPRVRDMDALMSFRPHDMRAISTQVDSRFMARERRLFATEGRSGGEAWPRLSEEYRRWKARRFPGRKIMQRTGRLRRSLTSKGGRHVLESTLPPRVSVTVGTSVKYAAYHIDGSPIRNWNLPERDTLQHTRAQEIEYLEVFSERYAKVILPRLERAMLAARFGRYRGRRVSAGGR